MRAWFRNPKSEIRNPKSEMGVVLGTQGGEIIVVNGQGKVEWRHTAGDRVMTVDAADVDGDGRVEILAGSDDGQIYLFDRTGELRWTFAPPFRDTGYNWWTLGSSKVRRVQAADLDGDGQAEILAGVGNMNLHVLDARGRPKWEFLTRYGVFRNFTTADYDGDGRLEVIGGTDGLSCVSDCLVINADGKQVAVLHNDGWVSSLSALLVVEGNWETGKLGCEAGETGAEFPNFQVSQFPNFLCLVCGTDWGHVRTFAAPEGRLLWQHHIGDGVTALAMRPGQILAASESCYVCAFGLDGERLWHTRLPDCVTALAVRSDGRAVAGDASEGLWWLDAAGKIVARWPIPGGVAELQPTESGALLVRSGAGEVLWLRER
jgi:hypothetical protein